MVSHPINLMFTPPENGWLEYKPFLLGFGLFSWVFAVSFREGRGFFPKQVYLWGSILGKKRLDTLLGALCCVGRAGLGWAWGLALVGSLGWAWDLVVLGALGWVGRGVWLWWAGLGWAWESKVVLSVIWFNWFTCTVWGLCWYIFFSDFSMPKHLLPPPNPSTCIQERMTP